MKWWLYGDEGPSVVLLHAFPCDHTLWEDQAEALANSGFQVHVPDLPGFGESDLVDGEPSLAAVVRALRADITHPTAVMGLSVGGYLAMEWLRQAPQQVTALGLVDTKASADSQEAQFKREQLAQLVESDPSHTARVLRAAMVSTLVSASSAQRREVLARLEQWFAAVPAETVSWYQRAMSLRPESFTVLRAFVRPALIMWGADDLLSTPQDHKEMCDVLPMSESVEIPDSGHLSAVEQPMLVSTALVEFLREALPVQ